MSDEGIVGSGGANGDSASAREEGMSLLRQGHFWEASAALRRAIEADPNDESAWRLLGGALASNGDTDAAVDAFQRSVDINPQSPKNHYNLAIALQSTGRLVEARAAIAQALVLDPNYQQAAERQEEIDTLLSSSPGLSDPAASPYPSASSASDTANLADPAASDMSSQQISSLPPHLDSGESRIPPPPPPEGYAPPPPMQPGGYRPPSPGSSYAPPSGDYPSQDPQGSPYAYAPPPAFGQAYGTMAPEVNGTTILVLAIVGIVCLQILSPISWVMANNALRTLDQYPYADQSQRGTIVAGRIIGMIGTGFLVLSVISILIMIIAGIAS